MESKDLFLTYQEVNSNYETMKKHPYYVYVEDMRDPSSLVLVPAKVEPSDNGVFICDVEKSLPKDFTFEWEFMEVFILRMTRDGFAIEE